MNGATPAIIGSMTNAVILEYADLRDRMTGNIALYKVDGFQRAQSTAMSSATSWRQVALRHRFTFVPKPASWLPH